MDEIRITRELPTVNDRNVYKIKKYRQKVDEIIDQILNLQDWNDYIEFNDKKYGLPKICGKIHRENNCGGTITSTHKKELEWECSHCRNWAGFNGTCRCDYKHIKVTECDKCDYLIVRESDYEF